MRVVARLDIYHPILGFPSLRKHEREHEVELDPSRKRIERMIQHASIHRT